MSAGIKRKGFLVMMKFFQKLGKSLMLPVACLPVCGILMGIGYILAPAAMAGEVQGFTAGGLAYSIGLFLIKAAGYEVITPVIVCNVSDFPDMVCHTGKAVKAMDEIITL